MFIPVCAVMLEKGPCPASVSAVTLNKYTVDGCRLPTVACVAVVLTLAMSTFGTLRSANIYC